MTAVPEAAFLPDPYAALLPEREEADVAGLASYLRQRRRRAGMLAAARRLLAEGEPAFTLRGVADASGVTVQTLRNCFGRREELMVSAIDDHTSAVWRALGRRADGPVVFLQLAEIYGACARATPDFLRATVTTAVADIAALGRLQRHGSSLKAWHLRRMAEQGVLRANVDAGTLAAQITRLNTFTIYEWAASAGAVDLRGELAAGNRLLLLGAVQARAASQIEAWTPALAA